MSGKSNTGMDVMTAIKGRCSVRSYAPGRLDENAIRLLLEAAVRAPTAIHEELWAFVVLQDPVALSRLADRAKVSFAADCAGWPRRI